MKTFNAKEQRIRDIILAIDTIEPVIDILREMFQIKDEQVQIHEEGIEKNGKIEAYNSMLEVTSDKVLIANIKAQINNLEEAVQEGIVKYNALEEKWNILAEEVMQYAEYIDSFEGLNVELAEEVFEKTFDEMTDRKFLATILLFTNTSVEDEEVFEFLLEVAIQEDLNKAIENTYADPSALYVYIGTTDLLNE